MLYIVYNKYSGGYSLRKIASLEKVITSKFDDFSIRQTVMENDRVNVDICPDEINLGDIIAAAGGDGTINACLQFIHENSLQNTVLLAVIPFGTGNNMVGSLSLKKNISKAVDTIKIRKTEKISYGLLNGTKAFFNCSIGFSSYVLKNRKTNSLTGYFYDTARLLPSYKSCRLVFVEDGKGIELFAGFFINTRVYMSKFKFLKKNNSDKKMNFFYIEGGNRISQMTDAVAGFTGIKKYKKIDKEKFEFKLPEGSYIELDGDIYDFSGKERTVSLINNSTVKIITNGDI